MSGVDMTRSVLGIVCALALGGCAGWMPSWDLGLSGVTMGGGGATELRLESEPSGAEARTSTGQACRTPCAVMVPATQQDVTFALAGFIPQTVPVLVRMPLDPRVDPNASPGVQLVPNPLAVTLEQAPPPVRTRPPPKRRAQRPPPPPPPSR
jgi:hypothetical protein